MFFALSKILWWIVAPSTFLTGFAVMGVGLWAFTRFRRTGRALALAGLAGLVIAAFSPLAFWLRQPLENRFPVVSHDLPAPTGIIVLGGSIDQFGTERRRGQVQVPVEAGRILEAAALAHRRPTARLVFSGGSSALIRNGELRDEAWHAQRLFVSLGIDPSRITIERQSRNTDENARFTRAMVDPKPGQRWVLVTSAYHMPRAIGLFRKAGFDVLAYPTDFATRDTWRELWRPILPASRGLDLLDQTVREWIGLAAYRASGRIDEIFPGPR